jgi:hypothetical protein
MISAIPIAAILGAADVNDARGYYHCRNGPNFARDYCGNHSVATVLVCSSVYYIISFVVTLHLSNSTSFGPLSFHFSIKIYFITTFLF